MTRPGVPAAPPRAWGPCPPALDRLAFGDRPQPIAEEAVVLGRIRTRPPVAPYGAVPDLLGAGRALVAEGAALLEAPLAPGVLPSAAASMVTALASDLGVPIVVGTGSAEVAGAALAAGASAVVPSDEPTPALLAEVARSQRPLLLPLGAWPGADAAALARAAAAAEAAGVARAQVLVEVGAVPRSAAGIGIVASDPPTIEPGSSSARARAQRSAAFALAIARGARLVRTTDPRSARRTSVTLAAILRAGVARTQAPA